MGLWSGKLGPGNLAKLISPLPDLMSLGRAEAQIITALRVVVMSQKCYRDARPYLQERLGSELAVNRFLILVESIGAAWPESVKIGRACCPHTMPDEILLLNMLRCAVQGSRPSFDALICEMIDPCSRDRIYLDMTNFVAAYGTSAVGGEG
ncbi:MAG: hypothetical protein ABJP02_07965 [Parasphingorhabdus sp.]|uniref:hypothetical protein n=1 Tax=Parasphingorhabdus sp. TaxID=2709688 RepID=UPI0032983F4F